MNPVTAAGDPQPRLAPALPDLPHSIFFSAHVVASLPAPWSMAFLPDGRMLVTERPPSGTLLNPTAEGHIRIVSRSGEVSAAIAGMPPNVGVLDVVLDPHFDQNRFVYISYIDRDPNAPRFGRNAADTRVDPAGIAVVRAVLDEHSGGAPELTTATVIWHQFPDVVSFPGSGEPGGRLAFSPDGAYLFIAAGDRQEFDGPQTLDNTLGKIVRIFPDGGIPPDNPFVGVAGALPEIWSLGHRNPYGLAFAPSGVLWENEMGPMGGDELNIVVPGANYGWPRVSYGDFYDGTTIARPSAGDGFQASGLSWTPVIAPSGMIDYLGDAFPQWRGDLIVSGLQSHGLVLVALDGSAPHEIARIDLGTRTRDVAQGPDGTLWVLLDQPDGRLVQLRPTDHAGHDGDFNGDGRADLAWRSGAGQFGDWLGAGAGRFVVNDGAALRSVDASWHVAGRGDFNGDGRDDLLWRNDNGAVGSWSGTASGGFIVNDAAISAVPTGWHVVATADVDGDGRDDIVWRNDNGLLGTWSGAAGGGFTINEASLTAVPTSWHLVAAADFDGDGIGDLLWRNDDGALGTWSGHRDGGFAVHDGAALEQVDVHWNFVGAGDFNGDGRADILWRNDDGTVADWLANASGGFTPNLASLAAAPGDWHIVSVGDYDGDGHDDLAWRNEDGTVATWLADANGSFTIAAATSVSVPLDWHLQTGAMLV